jgi:hypothetical protein
MLSGISSAAGGAAAIAAGLPDMTGFEPGIGASVRSAAPLWPVT